MATASRSTAEFNALYTSSIEKLMGGGRVEDIIFTANQLLWLLSKLSKDIGRHGFNAIQPLLTTKNTGVGWFEYDDSLSISSMPGPESAKFDLAFLGGPLVITEQEEIENREPHRLVSLIKFKFDQLVLSLSEEVNVAGYRGSGVNGKQIDGLEDMVFARTNLGTLPDVTRAQATQANNTYGGIARSATTPTGWENYAFNLLGTTANRFDQGFVIDYKTLERAYVYCSRGSIRPDLLLMSLLPYLHLHNLMAANATYEREVDQFRGIQLGHDNTKFRNAVVFYDEAAVGHSAAGSNWTAGGEGIYVLNTPYLTLPVEEGYDFALTKFSTPHDARISIGHMLWRGQQIYRNPRYASILFNY